MGRNGIQAGIISNIGTYNCNMAMAVTYLFFTGELSYNCNMENIAKICGKYRKNTRETWI
jgi:hypothetical protein